VISLVMMLSKMQPYGLSAGEFCQVGSPKLAYRLPMKASDGV